MNFFSPYRHEFFGRRLRSAHRCRGPRLNITQTLELVQGVMPQKIALVILPGLALSADAIDDLLFQGALLDRVEKALPDIVAASRDFPGRCCGGATAAAGTTV